MKYDEKKTTQLAAYFLRKSNGTLYLIKLLKLLYIADREAFRELGRPISFDRYVSMEQGPVLSHTYNLMNGAVQDDGYWSSIITPRDGHKLSISDESEVNFDALSDAELAIADEVYENFGHVQRFDLCKMTHNFDEWTDPESSSIPLSYRDVLLAVGYSEEDAEDSIEYIKEQQALSEFLESA
ncbi:MAG: SocA family protein [Candidatus Thiodiazotropha sp. (ex Dulcina madagascariensis)]|nr:SocA family protein [Candidatus Thiodiazotropha sp. (ex Dulcina madagascariensis)]